MAVQRIKNKKLAEIEMILMNKTIGDLHRSNEDINPSKSGRGLGLEGLQEVILDESYYDDYEEEVE